MALGHLRRHRHRLARHAAPCAQRPHTLAEPDEEGVLLVGRGIAGCVALAGDGLGPG